MMTTYIHLAMDSCMQLAPPGGALTRSAHPCTSSLHAASHAPFPSLPPSPLPSLCMQVECNVGEWIGGTVIKLWYSEAHWEVQRKVPYQVKLDDGRLVFAPLDHDRRGRGLRVARGWER